MVSEIHLHVRYVTHWGENLVAEILCGNGTRRVNMRIADEFIWQTDFTIGQKHLTYRYLVTENGIIKRREPKCRRIKIAGDTNIYDCWKDSPRLKMLDSAALKECIYPFKERDVSVAAQQLTFACTAMPPRRGSKLAIVGSSKELGEWNANKAIPLVRIGSYRWQTKINVPRTGQRIEYKYIIVGGDNDDSNIEWETGENRILTTNANIATLKDDGHLRFEQEKWRGAGVVIPLFSLISKHSQGIGDVHDLMLLTDWAHSVGMHAIQILPINDTTQTKGWADSYPYNSISVFALNPVYMDLRALGIAWGESTERRIKRLNSLKSLNYVAVSQIKCRILKKYLKHNSAKIASTAEYKRFETANAFWLRPYAAFSALRDKYGTADFRKWPQHNTYDDSVLADLCEDFSLKRDIADAMVTQYILNHQMQEAHAYARKKKVILKGDIPIGISRNSVPMWVCPELFDAGEQAGAPPDDFATKGQNWGFPTYRWNEMESDGYLWWKSRLKAMSQYFDAYRIDHVLGFFRIWQIPYGRTDGILGHFKPALPYSRNEIEAQGIPIHEDAVFDANKDIMKSAKSVLFIADEGRVGFYHPSIAAKGSLPYLNLTSQQKNRFDSLYENYFYHRHNDFWAKEAMKKLPALINATEMLACAEDLGMVPKCVGTVLRQLQIFSLEIQSMPKQFGREFANLSDNPYLSVATISTHDMPPMRLWWHNNKTKASHFYHDALRLSGTTPREMTTAVAEKIISDHLACPSALCLISLQDWLALDKELRSKDLENEQINHPDNSHQRWQYRMNVTLEQLLQAKSFNKRIKAVISEARRDI